MRIRTPIICFVIVSLTMITGCKVREYKASEQKVTSSKVDKSSYSLADQEIKTIEKSEYEDSDIVYYVEDEFELARILEYNINKDVSKISYQAPNKMDMDKTANYLSYIEPYDISLQLSTTDYENHQGELIYRSNEVEIINLDERYQQAKQAANQVYSKIITPNMDTDQKIKAIHDYLIKTTIYSEIGEGNNSKYPNVFKAAGALVDKNAVCSGYSRAFMMLARLGNIPAIYVSSDTMNHGWNLVYGNAGWRYIDVTWDDPVPDQPNHAEELYLNVSINEFMRDGKHIFDENKSSDYFLDVAKSYFNKNEEVFR